MKVFSIAVLVFMVASVAMKAQTFTERLESKAAGQGSFKVDQDPRLTDIVNGDVIIPSVLSTTSRVNSITTES